MTDRQKQLNEIVNVHLGKAGDGSAVNPYVNPDSIEPELIVPVPRYLNRTDYEIEDDNLPFVGVDVWNCYEVSALTDNGYPVTGVAKIVYPANSPSIVESKSLKLYLNSFNMAELGATPKIVIENIEKQIVEDLSAALETNVKVKFFTPDVEPSTISPNTNEYVEDRIDVSEVVFDKYNEDPSILKLTKGGDKIFVTNALRSNCRVTNQPDWGTLEVYIDGDTTFTNESFLQYVVSMRKENHFHEEIVECVFKRLYDMLPRTTDFYVAAWYTRRGGIDINPIRATTSDALQMLDYYTDESIVSSKTLHQ